MIATTAMVRWRFIVKFDKLSDDARVVELVDTLALGASADKA